MKIILTIALCILFFSCKTKTEDIAPLGTQWNIQLHNNLGTVSLILPKRLDTLFIWDQTSDCGDGCTHVDYRIQRKIFPIFRESGWYWDPLMDSVDQFTIKHDKLSYPYSQHDSGSSKYLKLLAKRDLEMYYSPKLVIDTCLAIHGRLFCTVGFSSFDSIRNSTYYYLNSYASANKNVLAFYFEHRRKNIDSISHNFINSSFDYLQTIKINDR